MFKTVISVIEVHMIGKAFQAILFWQKKEIRMNKCTSGHITSNFSDIEESDVYYR